MLNKIHNLISYTFYSLLFSVPLVMHPKTSELFEFNKIVLTYLFTALILFFWFSKMILSGRIIFKKTLLDPFLIVFFLSQLLSTVFSVDTRTSLFGYYSRFHGGLISTIAYISLYWAYVSNMDKQKTKKALQFLLASSLIVCFWAILEHFGKSFSCLIFKDYKTFDTSCWVQDVQNRVYATFGQPNWLAAWLVALIPTTWTFAIVANKRRVIWKKYIWFILSIELFITLLYTKSRSGILAFIFSALAYWLIIFIHNIRKKEGKLKLNKDLIFIIFPVLFFTLTVGTPWSPNINQLLGNNSKSSNNQNESVVAPALETGGTESGEIRKIVWMGTLDMWKDNPTFGTGVETFAFSYYKYRPAEHNLVSEWNFLYNKAHNEYLNFAATTGTVGLLSYLALILFSLLQITNYEEKRQEKVDTIYLRFALTSGFMSILITNFFGFSVVSIALLFFLFPAMASTLNENITPTETNNEAQEKLTNPQVILLTFNLIALIFSFYSLGHYWYADYLYSRGKLENDSGLHTYSQNTLIRAIKLSPKESVFWGELANSTSSMAVFYAENGDLETAKQVAKNAHSASDKAISLSPASVVLKKNRFRMFANLSLVEPSYLNEAKNSLSEAAKLAPTDAHIFYNLAILNFRTGDTQKFLSNIKKTIDLKPNYKEAHRALAQYYISNENFEFAANELKYILDNIGYDPEIQKELDSLNDKAKKDNI